MHRSKWNIFLSYRAKIFVDVYRIAVDLYD